MYFFTLIFDDELKKNIITHYLPITNDICLFVMTYDYHLKLRSQRHKYAVRLLVVAK